MEIVPGPGNPLPPARTIVEPDGTVVVRPSWRHYWAGMMSVPVFTAAVASVGLRAMRDDPVVGIVLAVGTAAICLGVLRFYFRRVKVEVGPRGFQHTRLIGTRSAPRERLGDVVITQQLRTPDPRTDATVVVTDVDGSGLAVLSSPYWTHAQLHWIVDALDRPTWRPDGPIKFKHIARRYPKAVPFRLAHPAITGTFWGIVLVAVVVLAVWATFEPPDSP